MELQHIAWEQWGNRNEMFANSAVALYDEVECPQRSPDLTHFDFSSGATWNHKFLSPLHAICRIWEIEFRLNSKILGRIQGWYAMLLKVWKKGHEFASKNMADMLNKSLQKQSPIGVRQNSCFANMQQIYRRTTVRKCDFNKFASNLFELTLPHGCSPVYLLHIWITHFLKSSYGRLLLNLYC